MDIVFQILTLIGSVTLSLFGLGLLSGGLQKAAGDGLRALLASMTSSNLAWKMQATTTSPGSISWILWLKSRRWVTLS